MATKMMQPPTDMAMTHDPPKPPPGNVRRKRKAKRSNAERAQKLYGKKG